MPLSSLKEDRKPTNPELDDVISFQVQIFCDNKSAILLIGQNQRPVTVLAIFTQNSLCYG
jgi:hypothetical protein